MAGPFAVVRRRLAEVVDPRPDEFAHHPVVVLLADEVILGEVAPAAVLYVVARGLMVGVLGHGLTHDGELVDPARADGRAGLRSEEEALRQYLMRRVVEEGAVVEARHVERASHARTQHRDGIVHTVGHRAGGILAVADRLQAVG